MCVAHLAVSFSRHFGRITLSLSHCHCQVWQILPTAWSFLAEGAGFGKVPRHCLFLSICFFLVSAGQNQASHRRNKTSLESIINLGLVVGLPQIFSSILPVAGSDVGRSKWTQPINTWLYDWCHCQNFGVFNNGALDLISDEICISQWGKRVFAPKLADLINRPLN